MDVSGFFDSDWLKGSDLPGTGQTVTIADVGQHTFEGRNGNPPQTKLALSFAGAKKRMALNKTQGRSLINLFGNDAQNWTGKQVRLSPAPSMNGQMTIVITSPPQVQQSDDEIPF